MSELFENTEKSNFYKFLSVDLEFNKIKEIIFEYSKNSLKNELNNIIKEYYAGNLKTAKKLEKLEISNFARAELYRFFGTFRKCLIIKRSEAIESELNKFANEVSDYAIFECKKYLIESFGELVLEHEFKLVKFININNSIEFQISCTSKTKASLLISTKINYWKSKEELMYDIKSNALPTTNQ